MVSLASRFNTLRHSLTLSHKNISSLTFSLSLFLCPDALRPKEHAHPLLYSVFTITLSHSFYFCLSLSHAHTHPHTHTCTHSHAHTLASFLKCRWTHSLAFLQIFVSSGEKRKLLCNHRKADQTKKEMKMSLSSLVWPCVRWLDKVPYNALDLLRKRENMSDSFSVHMYETGLTKMSGGKNFFGCTFGSMEL